MGDFEGFDFDLIRSLSMDSPIPDNEFRKATSAVVTDKVYSKVLDTYKRKG